MNEPRKAVKEDQQLANYIAMVIRNAMEDFQCNHLTDDQMKELNPIIRNAVCSALHAFNHCEKANAAARFVDYNFRMILTYWEQPELLEGYTQMWARDREATASRADQERTTDTTSPADTDRKTT